jgi:Glycosyl hydrolase family 99/Calcineurin-like phosphoesterase
METGPLCFVSRIHAKARRLVIWPVGGVVFTVAAAIWLPQAGSASTSDVALPTRAAFVYPWYPETWTVGGFYPHFHPSLGYYDSSNASVVQQHVAWLNRARVKVAIVSWWGPNTHEEATRVSVLLTKAGATALKVALYYEKEGKADPSASAISSDLSYVMDHYATNTAYARVGGKPVLFVYNANDTTCSVVDRWKSANQGRFYLVLKVFSGYRLCSSQPNGWHQYSPSARTDSQAGYSYSISPGFWKANESSARLARSVTEFCSAVRSMIASSAPWQLVTTFNEWGEGSQVESATEYGGAYINALANNGTCGSVVVAAAGDIACRPGSADGTSSCADYKTAALVLNSINPSYVLTLGDQQYEDNSDAEYAGRWNNGSSWGKLNAKTLCGIGNHEYQTSLAAGFFHNASKQLCGSISGYSVSRPYYAFDLGSWRVYSLNDECSQMQATGGGSCSTETAWLANDMTAHPRACTLAYWHEPFRSSGQHGNATQAAPLWQTFADHGGDLVLSGHNHSYERFAPLDRNGNPATGGMREFVVGTGGKNHYGFPVGPLPGEEKRDNTTFGVLKLTLSASSYTWQFVPAIATGSFADGPGTDSCR